MTDRLKIAYLCDITPLDPNLYSGGNARIYNALQRHVGDVTILSNSWHLAEPLRRLVHALPEALNLRLRWRLHLLLSRIIARGVAAEIARGDFDAVFCAYSFQSLAHLSGRVDVPIIFTSDATPTTYKMSEVGQSFGSFLSVSRYFDPWVTGHETRIVQNADLLLWPSEWIKRGAESYLDAPQKAAYVVPWGANVPPVAHEAGRAPLAQDAPIELLFVGRDWFAKGGPMARSVVQNLNARGLRADLTVIGCTPPADHIDANMQIIAQLDKSIPEDMTQFEDCFRNAHFLVNPSFESYGFAYCEAAAYGLPALALNVGGVPVREGINGHMFAADAPAVQLADCIAGYIDDPDAYRTLRASARSEYEMHLNWDAWGKAAQGLIQGVVRDQ